MKKDSAGGKSEIHTPSFIITRDNNGIIYRHVKADAHVGIEELEECEELCLSMNGGKKILTVIDARNFHTLTPEATEYLRATQTKSRIATAVVSGQLSQKITASFVRDKVPVKIFPSESEAVKWLLTFKRKA